MDLPVFRYHVDPLASGSVVASGERCVCCAELRGFIYTGPIYSEEPAASICPWCIADGAAHRLLNAEFADCHAFDESIPEEVADVICRRTPGFDNWNGERWPACCGDACAFVAPMGIDELRAWSREAEGLLMSYIVHDLGVSGGAATRLAASLKRDQSPTLMVFRCPTCLTPKFDMDSL